MMDVPFVHAGGVGFPRGWRWSVPNMTMKPVMVGAPIVGPPAFTWYTRKSHADTQPESMYRMQSDAYNYMK